MKSALNKPFRSRVLILLSFIFLLFVSVTSFVDTAKGDEFGENLLLNPGFEDAAGGEPSSWEVKGNWNDLQVNVLAEAARSGEQGVQFSVGIADDYWLRQTVEIEGGQAYELSAWIKSDIHSNEIVKGRAQMKVEFYHDTTDAKGWVDDVHGPANFDSYNDWENISMQVETPHDANVAQVYIRLYGPGVAYYDDVSFHMLEQLDVPELQISTDEVFYYENVSEAKVTVMIQPADGVFNDKTVDIHISPENGGDSIVSEIGMPASEQFAFHFNPSLMNLQEPYKVEAVLKTQEGDQLIKDQTVIYRWERPAMLEEDGTIMVDGEPFFPIIGYHVPIEDYPNVKESINTVQGLRGNPDRYDFGMVEFSLDEAQRNGLKVLLPLYPDVWHMEGSRGHEYVKEKVATFKDHPALLGWMIEDEPMKYVDRGHSAIYEELAEVYRNVRSIDPIHPTYMVVSDPYHTRGFEPFGQLTDVVVADPYPIPNEPITLVSEHIREAKTYHPEKPVWNILQAFMYPGDSRWPYLPSITEFRHMAYQSLLEGAQGLGYYAFTDPSWSLMDSELYPAIVEFTEKEIPHLSSFILNGKQVADYNDGQVQWGIWEQEHELYAVVINLAEESQFVTIQLPSDGYQLEFIAPEFMQSSTFSNELSLQLSGLESTLIKLPPFTSSAEMKKLVQHFESEGDIMSSSATRALSLHLTAVDLYEQQGNAPKVIKHMQGFNQMLQHQRDQELISERAFQSLHVDREALIQQSAESLLQFNLDIQQTKVVAGETFHGQAYVENISEQSIQISNITIHLPEEFEMDSLELTVQELLPGQRMDVSFEVEVPENTLPKTYPLMAHVQFEQDGVEMGYVREKQVDILPFYKLRLKTSHISVHKPGEYPVEITLKNSAPRPIQVFLADRTYGDIRLTWEGPMQIDPEQTVDIEGSIYIPDVVPEGKYEVVIDASVNEQIVYDLSIKIDYNRNLVQNPGFEEGFSFPENWYIQSDANWEWVQDEVHSGQYAITLFPSVTGSGGISSADGIPVLPGKTYQVSFWAQNASTNGGSFGIRRSDANNRRIDYKWHDLERESDWTYYTFIIDPTNETRFVSIQLRLEEGSDNQIWFDDFHMEEIEDGHDGNLLTNPGFEILDGGIPVSWNASNNNWDVESGVSSTRVARTGHTGMKIATESTDNHFLWQQIDVEGGKQYELSAWLKSDILEAGKAKMKVEFYRDRTGSAGWMGQQLGDEHGTYNEWENISMQFEVPQDANIARVYLRLYGPGEAYYDDVSLREIDRIP